MLGEVKIEHSYVVQYPVYDCFSIERSVALQFMREEYIKEYIKGKLSANSKISLNYYILVERIYKTYHIFNRKIQQNNVNVITKTKLV